MTARPRTSSPATEARTLSELVLSGDCACAAADGDQLADIARLLALCVNVPEQIELELIAHLARVDLPRATRAWSAVTQRLLKRGVVRARGTLPPPLQDIAR